jgi:hypothetical protein
MPGVMMRKFAAIFLVIFLIYELLIYFKSFKIGSAALVQAVGIVAVLIVVAIAVATFVRERFRLGFILSVCISTLPFLFVSGGTKSVLLVAVILACFVAFFEKLGKFTWVYLLFAWITNVPNLYPSLSISFYFKFITILMVLGVFTWVAMSIGRSVKLNPSISLLPKPRPKFDAYAAYVLTMLIMLCGVVFSFTFDDLNGYLWIPFQSYLSDYTLVSEKLPASLTFISSHNLGLGTYVFWALGANGVVEVAMPWKAFNSILYAITTFLFICEAGRTLPKIPTALIVIAIFPSFVFGQIIGNQTDYALYLASLYVVLLFLKGQRPKLAHIILAALFLSVSPKSFVPFVAYFLFNIFRVNVLLRSQVKLALAFGLAALIVCPIYIRNYIYTGNPTFPANNHVFRSEAFWFDGIVAKKYKLDHSIGFADYLKFLLNDPASSSIFYGGDVAWYGRTILVLFAFVVAGIFVIKTEKFGFAGGPTLARQRSLLFFGASGAAFLLTNFLVGLQHRYIFSSAILFAFGIVCVLSLNYFQRSVMLMAPIAAGVSLASVLTVSVANNVSNLPLSYSGQFIYDARKNWVKKYEFYSKVNNVLGRDDKVLMFYIQDKIFLKSKNIHELDWYDYPVQRVFNAALAGVSPENQASTVYSFLCNENFKYVILDNRNSLGHGDVRKYLRVVVDGEGQRLYSVDCN